MSKSLHDRALAYHKDGGPGKLDVTSHKKNLIMIKISVWPTALALQRQSEKLLKIRVMYTNTQLRVIW